MTVKELLDKIDNWSCHVMLVDNKGEALLETIWFNLIPNELINACILNIQVTDYKLKIEIDEDI